MAMIATLVDAVDRDTHWKVTISYDDSVNPVIEEASNFTGTTIQQLRQHARRTAVDIENNETVDLLPFIGETIDVTPPPPPDPPTQDELDKIEWFEDDQTLTQMIEVLTRYPALATPGRIAVRDALIAKGEAGWKDSYLGDI